MQVAHQHGRGDSLAGNVAEQEKKTVFVFDQVKVIPAYQRGRLVVVSRLPLANRPVGPRQKSTLDSGGQHQVALQCALFFGRKMVQAEAQQGIAEQPVRFDGVVADFANTEGSAGEAC